MTQSVTTIRIGKQRASNGLYFEKKKFKQLSIKTRWSLALFSLRLLSRTYKCTYDTFRFE